jgi:hypothetical protein
LVLGGLAGSVPDPAMDAVTLEDKDVTMVSLAFEGVYLGLPSSYGNFHCIEFSAGVRCSPWDFWASSGTAISFLNVGRGDPGSDRAYEAFVESYSRQDDRARDDREVSGLGAGFGMTLF